MARRLGRNFIGIEREPVYADAAMAAHRGGHAARSVPTIMASPEKRSEPRIPFLSVVEAGLLAPGAILTDERRRYQAMVRADGALAFGNLVGIHPQDRRARAGPAGLQWLDLLAHRGSRRASTPIDDVRARPPRQQMADAA